MSDSQTCVGAHQPRWVNPPTTHYTPMVCAICAQDNPVGFGQLWGVTQVGLLWVCGGHVQRAIEAQSTTDSVSGVSGGGQ